MRTSHKLLHLLLTSILMLMLSACNTKTSQEESNTTGSSNPTTQTGDSGVDGDTGGIINTTQEDTVPPVITLNGEANVSLFVGSDYTELGATAVDAVEGNVSVAMSGTVDTSTAGTYVITYTVRDSVGNEANITRTVTVVVPVLTSLSLSSSATALNVGATTELTLMGTYSDNTSKTVTQGIAYVITPSNSVEVNGTVLTAKKDGNVTVQAKVGTTLSNTIALTITWIVDGHRLPPEPDPAVNNATLLGIDSNNNGVRDDVERWIYETYDHPIERGIFMQSSRAYQKVIVDPIKALETMKYIDNVTSCRFYWMDINQYLSEKYEYIHFTKKMRKIQFNTLIRHMAYERYNGKLSGGVYDLLPANKEKCEFDDSGILGDIK